MIFYQFEISRVGDPIFYNLLYYFIIFYNLCILVLRELFHVVSLGFGLGVYFTVGIFPPSPPPTVNFAVGNVCRLSVCSGFGTSRLAYFGVDLAQIWYMGHGCRVDWAFLPGSLCLILLLLLLLLLYMYIFS